MRNGCILQHWIRPLMRLHNLRCYKLEFQMSSKIFKDERIWLHTFTSGWTRYNKFIYSQCSSELKYNHKLFQLTEDVHWITSRQLSPSPLTNLNHSPASLSLHSSVSKLSSFFGVTSSCCAMTENSCYYLKACHIYLSY